MAKKNTTVESTIIKDINEDTNQVKKFFFILIGVALVSLLVYLISSKVLIKDGATDGGEETETTIAYTDVKLGNVFNRPYDEYYVFAYDPDSLKASYYASLLNNFNKEKGKLYYMDLSLEINKKALADTSNKNATNPNELKLKEPTLIKIKNGKIDKYIDTVGEIETELK